MNRVFAVDGQLYKVMNKVANLAVLNLLWIICSLPVVTIGISTTSVYYVLFKMKRSEDDSVVKLFFRAWREDFRIATVSWLILMAVGGLFVGEILVLRKIDLPGELVVRCVFMMFFLFTLMISDFIFSVQAYFKNSLKRLWSNSVRLALGFLPKAFLISLLTAGPVFLFWIFRGNISLAVFLELVIGISGSFWLKSLVLNRIFKTIQ